MNATRLPLRRTRYSTLRRGAVAVEFALTATALFTFLFAALEFGRYNMILQSASNAAFEGARRCIVPGANAADGQTTALGVLSAVGITGGSVVISPTTLSTTTTQVSAKVTIPVSSNLWLMPVFSGTGSVSKTITLYTDWSAAR